MTTSARQSRRGILSFFAIGGGAALATFAMGCAGAASSTAEELQIENLPPPPSGPVPPNTVPVRCPW